MFQTSATRLAKRTRYCRTKTKRKAYSLPSVTILHATPRIHVEDSIQHRHIICISSDISTTTALSTSEQQTKLNLWLPRQYILQEHRYTCFYMLIYYGCNLYGDNVLLISMFASPVRLCLAGHSPLEVQGNSEILCIQHS